jgi:hypothetical protein
MLQKILGKIQFVFFNAGNSVVREECACEDAGEMRLERIAAFAREHGINYGRSMSYWMLGKEE